MNAKKFDQFLEEGLLRQFLQEDETLVRKDQYKTERTFVVNEGYAIGLEFETWWRETLPAGTKITVNWHTGDGSARGLRIDNSGSIQGTDTNVIQRLQYLWVNPKLENVEPLQFIIGEGLLQAADGESITTTPTNSAGA